MASMTSKCTDPPPRKKFKTVDVVHRIMATTSGMPEMSFWWTSFPEVRQSMLLVIATWWMD
jgi:hypothetical protein